MSEKVMYWSYEMQVYLACTSGVSIAWLRKQCRELAASKGMEAVFEHKPRIK